uniref:Mediator of RNA polymerase II transcription subunit 26 n=1 Tax=Nyssomyia neivai TaxID=330878 RepID=A0A1L8DFY9_9DIPT
MNQSVSELSRRLENALDTEYNVIDMETVLEIISVLENTRVTIEQLENSQLTKCISQLRRRTMDEVLARRSKKLIKQWRTLLPQIPNAKVIRAKRQNGDATEEEDEGRRRKRRRKQISPEDDDVVLIVEPPPSGSASNSSHIDRGTTVSGPRAEELNFRGKFSRVPSTPASPTPDVSSSSAFKANSPHDSRSVSPANQETIQAKRRGRKKGSRGVDSLIADSYDTSPYLEFKHKVASGPKKVKTTKELIADLQNRKLTASSATSSPILPIRPTSPSAINQSDGSQSRDLFVDVPEVVQDATAEDIPVPEITHPRVMTIEEEISELRRQLACLIESQQAAAAATKEEEQEDEDPACTCVFSETHETDELETKRPSGFGEVKTAVTDREASPKRPHVRSIFDLDEADDGRVEIYPQSDEKGPENAELDAAPSWPTWRCIEDPNCPARVERGEVTAEDVRALHSLPLEHVNGNWSLGAPPTEPETDEMGLYRRVVPQYNELVMGRIPKGPESDSTGARWHRSSDNEDTVHTGQNFREWFETVQTQSYNDELLTILPYVLILVCEDEFNQKV